MGRRFDSQPFSLVRTPAPSGLDFSGVTPGFLKRRAALYIDGYNLHHSILDLGRRELLWLDLPALGRSLIDRRERLASTVWVSAHKPDREPRMRALFAYERALKARGVRCLMGHFVMHGEGCRECGNRWTRSVEKQSDVNLALSLAADAVADRFDVAYLLTTDGDHAATARFVKETTPKKRLVNVVPPDRLPNRQVAEWCDAVVYVEPEMLEAAMLPERMKVSRTTWIERPIAWVEQPPRTPRRHDPDPTPPSGRAGHLRLVVSN